MEDNVEKNNEKTSWKGQSASAMQMRYDDKTSIRDPNMMGKQPLQNKMVDVRSGIYGGGISNAPEKPGRYQFDNPSQTSNEVSHVFQWMFQ